MKEDVNFSDLDFLDDPEHVSNEDKATEVSRETIDVKEIAELIWKGKGHIDLAMCKDQD